MPWRFLLDVIDRARYACRHRIDRHSSGGMVRRRDRETIPSRHGNSCSQLQPCRLRQPRSRWPKALVETAGRAGAGRLPGMALRRHRRITRRLMLATVRPLPGAAGPRDPRRPAAAVELLRWAVGQQRPTARQPRRDRISRDAWLDRTSWRPVLALACQYGFMAGAGLPRPLPRPCRRGGRQPARLWVVGAEHLLPLPRQNKRALATLPARRARSPPATLCAARAGARLAVQHAGRRTGAAEARAAFWHHGAAAAAGR